MRDVKLAEASGSCSNVDVIPKDGED